MPRSTDRDEFSSKVRKELAGRAGNVCSFPGCGQPTEGASLEGATVTRSGVASHICAAAPGGKRYDPGMTPDERSSAANGIWLCQTHSRTIDSDDPAYRADRLRQWKAEAEARSALAVLGLDRSCSMTARSSGEQLASAVQQDLEAFRRTGLLPDDALELTLAIDGIDDNARPSDVASLLLALRDFVIIATPGAGKSVTMLQVAEHVRVRGGLPIYLPLAEWSAHGSSLIEWVARRRAFSAVGSAGLQEAMAAPGVVLVLDGWNELDETSRLRARGEIAGLQRDYPDLRFVLSTRQPATHTPFDGTIVRVRPLEGAHQFAMGRSRRGTGGDAIVDRALRTPGIRELIASPLYLASLLDIPTDGPFPETQEEVLRYLIAAHDRDAFQVEGLTQATEGFQIRFLERLAVEATRAATTAIAEADARAIVSSAQDQLVEEGQLATKIQPQRILTALVNRHLLLQPAAGEPYRFQHQQLQEWFGSREVERLMLLAPREAKARTVLREEILDIPAWEESTLFACERLSRGDHAAQKACAAAILDALLVEPILAADMIFRATEAVWDLVKSGVMDFVKRWHQPGQPDRAFLFMARSGRPDFSDHAWRILITTDGRNFPSGHGFQVSVLGKDAAKKIQALPAELRRKLLWQLSMDAGVAGLELVEEIAKGETNPELQAEAVAALDFRAARRQLETILLGAPDATYDRLVRKYGRTSSSDPRIADRLAAALQRATSQGESPYERLKAAVEGEADDETLAKIIGEVTFADHNDPITTLVFRAREKRPQAVAFGLVARVRNGAFIPYWAKEVVAAGALSLEADDLVGFARTPKHNDHRAEAAVAALGPGSIGKLFDDLLFVQPQQRNPDGSYNQAASNWFNLMQHRLQSAGPAVLLSAVLARPQLLDAAGIGAVARVLMGDRGIMNPSDPPYAPEDQERLADIMTDWAEQLLADPHPNRWALAEVAGLARCAPLPRLLPLLKRMLDADLRGWCTERKEALTRRLRMSQARMSYANQYYWAFAAIRDPSVPGVLEPYLQDDEFGTMAGTVIRNFWLDEHLPPRRGLVDRLADYSGLTPRRKAREDQPGGTSPAAEQIFAAIDRLFAEGDFETNAGKKRLAVRLAVVASVVPHGKRQAVFAKLLEIAERRDRGDLLAALAWSGEAISSEMVLAGIEEVLEGAKTQPWMLDKNQDQLRIWLELLAFSDNPMALISVIASLPDHVREPWRLDNVVSALGHTPGEAAEAVLFKLAAADPRHLGQFGWQQAITRKDPLSSGRRLLDLVVEVGAKGRLAGDTQRAVELLAEMMQANGELRRDVYARFTFVESESTREALMHAMLEAPDPEGLLLVVKQLVKSGKPFPRGRWRAVERIFTRKEPVPGEASTYTVHAVSAEGLRGALLELVTDGGGNDAAATCLAIIDDVRDEYGSDSLEPRHPNLKSGRAWPILRGSPALAVPAVSRT